MRRLIWGFADCWKSHVTAQLYSFEASDAKSDINSCSDPVCLLGPWFLPLIWFGKTSEIFWIQTIFKLWKQVRERERERERREREREIETSAYIRISCNLEKYHEWVLKSFSCASAFARQIRIFDGIDALYAFYRIPKCLNWRNILSWIPLGSDLDPNSDNVFFSFLWERGSKYHKKQAIIGPPAKHRLMAFRWRADDGQTLNAGLVVLIISGDSI